MGNDKRKEAQVDITGGLTGTIAARFVGLVRDGDLQIPGQRNDRLLAMPSISFTPTDDTSVTLIGLYQKDDMGTQSYLPANRLPGYSAGPTVSYDFFSGEPDLNHMDSEYIAGSLLIDHRFSDNIQFASRTRYFHMDVDYAEIFGWNTYADAERTLLNRLSYALIDEYQGISTDNNIMFNFNTGNFEHKVLVGIDYLGYERDYREGNSPGAAPNPAPIDLFNPQYGAPYTIGYGSPRSTSHTQLGIYIQEQLRYADRVSLVLGLRHDHATSKLNGVTREPNKAWTFRAGLIGDLTDTISPYASYSESFLPTFGVNMLGVHYKPRRGRQYEVGVKWQPTNRALVTMALFDIRESNSLTRDPDNVGNQIQAGMTGSQGGEIEVKIDVPGDFQFTGSYSYVDAKILRDNNGRQGFRVDNLPEHQASIWGTKSFDLSDDVTAKIGGGIRYISNKVDRTMNYIMDSVTLADAMASVDYGDWTLSINASNIFNTRWYTNCTYSVAVAEGSCYAGTARTLLTSLRYKF